MQGKELSTMEKRFGPSRLGLTESLDQVCPVCGGEGRIGRFGWGFTIKEEEIAGWLVRGKVNKEIAMEMRIEEMTVKHHLSRMYGKAGVSNRLEMVLKLLGQGVPWEEKP